MAALVFGLLPIAVAIGLVVVVARAVRGDGVDWGRLVGEFFVHLGVAVLALVAAAGLSRLLGLALAGPGLLRADRSLAVPVTFTAVGVPLFLAATWWLVDRIARGSRRRESVAWALHLAVVALSALVTAMVAIHDLADLALGGTGTWAEPVADLVVWGGLWVAYRWLERTHGPERWSILHVIGGSAIGLGTAAAGLGALVAALVAAAVFGDALVLAGDPARDLVVLVLGGSAWTAYWLRDGIARERDAWWYGWVLLGPVLVGLVALLGAIGYVLHLVAVWLLGDPVGSAAQHFEGLPEAMATAVVAALAWASHRVLLAPRADRPRTEVDRLHDLLLAGVGLLAAAGGAGTVLVALVEAVVGPGVVERGTDPVNTLLAALVLLVVGGPVWWRAWSRVQRLATMSPAAASPDPASDALDAAPADGTDGPDAASTDAIHARGSRGDGGAHGTTTADPGRAERRSPSRRVYLVGWSGVAGLAALGALLVAVVDALEDVFDGTLSLETLQSMRFSLAVLATAGAVAALHLLAWRRDRDLDQGDEAAAGRFPARVTLVGAADPGVVAAVRAASDAHVELWPREDGSAPAWDADRVVSLLDGGVGQHVLVVAGPDRLEAIAVQHGRA